MVFTVILSNFDNHSDPQLPDRNIHPEFIEQINVVRDFRPDFFCHLETGSQCFLPNFVRNYFFNAEK